MSKALLRVSLVAFGLLWVAVSQTVLAEEVKRYVVPGSRAAGLESCVEPTERMRRMHMEFIKHQRISTVHQGIRGTKYTLAGCVECHISQDQQGTPRPINQPDQFCGACHAYAAVHLNCFDCHASVPKHMGADAEAAHREAGVAALVEGGGQGGGH